LNAYSYGIFGDGDSPRDTVWIAFAVHDTTFLNFSDADTYFVRRYFNQELIDSVSGTASTNRIRTGFYSVPKKAFDGSHYGQYIVEIEVHKQSKTSKVSRSYLVVPGGLFGLKDTSKAQAKGFLTSDDTLSCQAKNVNTVTGNVNGSVNSVIQGVVVSVNNDKTAYSLTSDEKEDIATRIWDEDSSDHNISGSYGEVLETRGTSNLSSSDNIGINWNDIVNKGAFNYFSQTSFLAVDSNRTEKGEQDPDTLANHVWIWSDRTLTSGTGSGANQVVITTRQSSDSAEISGVQVQILNLNQTSTLGLLSTNASGKAAFALNNDTLLVRMYKPGWIFNTPETLIVSGNTDTVYYADLFNPGSPPSADLCRVYGWIKDIQNLPLSGSKIEASIKTVPLRYQGVIISPYFKSTSTDSDGYWYLDLYPNTQLSPDTTKYEFFIYSTQGTILRLKTIVPEQSSWELSF
jgi:hypothetical protein